MESISNLRHRRYVKKISSKAGLTSEQAEFLLNNYSMYGISEKEYMKHRLYSISDNEEISNVFAQLAPGVINDYNNTDNIRYLKRYSKRLSNNENIPINICQEAMIDAYRKFKITPKEYYKWGVYYLSDTAAARKSTKNHRMKRIRKSQMSKLSEKAGIMPDEISAHIKQLNSLCDDITINLYSYSAFGLYQYYPYEEHKAETEELLAKLSILKEKETSIKELLHKIDADELNYDDIKDDFKSYTDYLKALMSPNSVSILVSKLQYNWPDVDSNDIDTAADMYAMKAICGYGYTEYVSFHFKDKTLEERRAFLPEILMTKALRPLNGSDVKDILDNKYLAYSHLKELYGRKAELICGPKDIPKFINFIMEHRTFVKKSNYDSLGKGINKVEVTEDTDIKELFNMLSKYSNVFLIEELIDAHESIKFLNSDSVNTIRIVTLSDGINTEVLYTFMKIGRAGSFVDNGGAGGILVSIDKNTGIFNSNGIDEKGLRYDDHPDHGYRFEGYALPDFDSAIATALKASASIPQLRYVGWDLTYTKDNRWIIIEGNALSQFIGQQATVNKGLKKEFYETLDRFNVEY